MNVTHETNVDSGLGPDRPTPLLVMRGITKNFGDVCVLNEADLEVNRGEIVCVIGRSGSGKSTLLRCVNLLVEPSSGELAFDDQTIGTWKGKSHSHTSARSLRQHRRRLGMVFQHFELFPHLTALDNVAIGPRYALGVPKAEANDRARALLERVGLGSRTHQKPSTLSGGQKQRVAIARALAMEPTLLLLDEPTSALDPEMVGGILDLLAELAREGMTMIVVTHELGFAAKVATRVVVVDEGRVVEQGPPDQVLFNPATEPTRSLIKSLTAYHLNDPVEPVG